LPSFSDAKVKVKNKSFPNEFVCYPVATP